MLVPTSCHSLHFTSKYSKLSRIPSSPFPPNMYTLSGIVSASQMWIFCSLKISPPPPPPRTSWRRFAGALFQRSKISHLRSDHYTTWSYRGGKIVSSTMAFSYLFGNTQMSILSWLLEAEKSSVLPQISATFLGMPKCLFCRGCSRGKIVSSTTDFSYLFGNARMSIFFLQQL